MRVLRNAPSVLVLGFLGYGISISNTVEALKAFLFRDSGAFKRTPKYAIMESDGTWRDKKYQVPVDFASIVEALSISFAALSIIMAIHYLNYGLILILSIYCAAFLFVFLATLFQSGSEKATLESAVKAKRVAIPLVTKSRLLDTENNVTRLAGEG